MLLYIYILSCSNKYVTNVIYICPKQRDACCEIFLSTLTVRVIQKTSAQNFIR